MSSGSGCSCDDDGGLRVDRTSSWTDSEDAGDGGGDGGGWGGPGVGGPRGVGFGGVTVGYGASAATVGGVGGPGPGPPRWHTRLRVDP
jgi:hypothetical protein